MARREVVEVTCDRCGKTEIQTSSQLWKGEGQIFHAKFEDKPVVFEDLCTRCRRAMANIWSRILRVSDDEEDAKNETPGVPTDRAS